MWVGIQLLLIFGCVTRTVASELTPQPVGETEPLVPSFYYDSTAATTDQDRFQQDLESGNAFGAVHDLSRNIAPAIS